MRLTVHTIRGYLIPRLTRLAMLAALAAPAAARAETPHASIAPDLSPHLKPPEARPPAPQPAPAPAPIAAALTAPAPASKAPSFELIDRGDAVEVIARNIKAARTAILPLRSRLQVPIVGTPVAKRMLPGDATVKLVELDSEDATRVLSVKLGFERLDVKTLSRFAQAIQVGDDLHVIVPRKIPADGTAPALPEPTLSPALAAAVAKADLKTRADIALGPPPNPAAPPAPVAKPAARPAPAAVVQPGAALPVGVIGPVAPANLAVSKPVAAPPVPANPVVTKPEAVAASPAPATLAVARPEPVAAVTQPEAVAPAAAAEHADKVLGPPMAPHARPAAAAPHARTADSAAKLGDDKLAQTLAPASDDSWSKISMYAALGLAAAGAGAWMMRRRRLNIPPAAEIDILAQRSLGGKARLVWLSAGPHEMLVAVTGQQINLLGQWPKGTPSAATFAGTMATAVAELGAPGMLDASRGALQPLPLPRSRAKSTSGSFARRPTEPSSDALPEAMIDVGTGPVPATARHTSGPVSRATASHRSGPIPRSVEVALDVDDVITNASDDAGDDPGDAPMTAGVPASISGEPSARASRPAIVLPPLPAELRARRDSVLAADARAGRPSRSPAPPADPRGRRASTASPAAARLAEAEDEDAAADALRGRRDSIAAAVSAVAAARADSHAEPADKPLSPAVSGILRLRGRTGQVPITPPVADEDDEYGETAPAAAPPAPAINDDVATDDPEADQQWIKEILAATGGK